MFTKKSKYYSLKNILSKECQYNIIIGERSNGKTYSVLLHCLSEYCTKGNQFAYIRRWREDFVGKRGSVLFDSLVKNGEVEKLTNGEYNNVYYYSSRWYLCFTEDGERKKIDEIPFAYGFSIASSEHDKSTSFPNVTNICFDEFLTRKFYLPDEFVLFMNLLSTVIRDRNNVKIFMLGNTVNNYSPYFSEMGLNHIKKMKQGDIDIYTYGNSKLRVAVELCAHNKKGKQSDVYFAFDNPKLQMITGGYWEVNTYPHAPFKILPKDIKFIYYISFDNELLQCEIITKDGDFFTYIHPKTSDIKNNNIIYTPIDSHKKNYIKNILKPRTNIERTITEFFIQNKIFYSSNEVGEIVNNYLMYCKR